MSSTHAHRPQLTRSPSGLIVVHYDDNDHGARQHAETRADRAGEAAQKSDVEAAQKPEVEVVPHPDKLVRLAVMVRHLLAELKQLDLDTAGRARLRAAYERVSEELTGLLPEELAAELDRLRPKLHGLPSQAELRVAHAQLLGWLDGISHGVYVAMALHQANLARQLQSLRNGEAKDQGAPEQGASGQGRSGEHPPSQQDTGHAAYL
ncbi:hypothetical protein LI90_692 [Carbonactinospora thermoautotrophica]|uniref:Bacterial proteasome activator n=1 Tax=Carbonactinospora thermoautotrophica TaxID=1469144 RepID=A0A132MMH3_9ACTN|nr:proteasome activator [Carbonactinospora thermoautotrophica]KWW99060.1 hypothetical protein LI90_692 [Carbonactinospora thermoautotrophica]